MKYVLIKRNFYPIPEEFIFAIEDTFEDAVNKSGIPLEYWHEDYPHPVLPGSQMFPSEHEIWTLLKFGRDK